MDCLDELDGAQVSLGGLVIRSRQAKIKSGPNAGRFMARFVLEGIEGAVAVALFADQFEKFHKLVKDEAVVLVSGQLRERGGEFELRAEKIELLSVAPNNREVLLQIGPQVSMGQMLELRNLLVEHPGSSKVVFRMSLPEAEVSVAAGSEFRVSPEPALLAAAEQLLGDGSVTMRELTGDLDGHAATRV
jgi:DNA polymerase-3 subunit alpha